MNRSKRPLTKQSQKSIKKAVRASQRTAPTKKEKDLSDLLTEKELKKKFPKKPLKKQKAGVAKAKAATPVKAKKKKTVSKRTNTGEVPSTSAPAHIHPEGVRWIKTLTSQAKAKRKVDTRRSAKKK